MAIQIFIDSDACPVKDEAIRVATRYSLHVTLVSNQGMRPLKLPNVTQIVVSAKFDAADDWIVEHIAAGDVVITNDIPLAARALSKGGSALTPSGHIFTPQNIGAALALRDLNAHLRETGESAGHNPGFTQKDRSQFLQSLDKMVRKGV
jgi:uncharacterized protein YaiI (UPF0178 family)